ncbi:MAG: ErfK/YbiS/YcfS/YnhG family protein [uncultured bacterium]|nr:MAG: ErfK/YbiS/YcfS/YnhG family protein [uncultured bacterium]
MFSYVPHKNNKHNPKTVIFTLAILSISALAAFSVQAYSYKLTTVGSLEKAEDIDLAEKIVINFSYPVVPESVENNFSISPASDVLFKWEDGNSKLIISPAGNWKAATSYVFSVTEAENIFFKKFQQAVSFKTRSFPKILKFYPTKDAKDVAVDMEQPVSVSFDEPIGDYNVKFVVDPFEQLAYEVMDGDKQIRLLAKNSFKWGTDYSIDVFMKYKNQSSDEYTNIGNMNFSTVQILEPVDWEDDLEKRAAQAIKFTKPVIEDGKYIDVNLSKQTMVIFENGKPSDSFIVSSSKKGMDTPLGNFKIENKSPRAWSSKYSLWMPNWMAIVPSGEIGFHELPVWPGGYQEGANHLGTPVSHGCIRLGPGKAKQVFDWAETGTPVVIHN